VPTSSQSTPASTPIRAHAMAASIVGKSSAIWITGGRIVMAKGPPSGD
jgi:hypothetical protein